MIKDDYLEKSETRDGVRWVASEWPTVRRTGSDTPLACRGRHLEKEVAVTSSTSLIVLLLILA